MRSHIRLPKLSRTFPLLIAGFVVAAAERVAAQSVTLVKQFGDWSLYEDTASPKTLCFVIAQPASSEPEVAKRQATHLYVTAWPKDGIKTEPSLKLGYRARKASEIKAAVGNTAFKLFAKDERAYVSDATEELKLLEAMKKGSKLVVTGTPERGPPTTDTYSLAGLSQALQQLAACR